MRRLHCVAGMLLAWCVTSPLAAQEFRFQATGLHWNRSDNLRSFDWFSAPGDRFDPTKDLYLESSPGMRYGLSYESSGVAITGSFTVFETFTAGRTRGLGSNVSFDLSGSSTLTPMTIATGINQAAVQEEDPLGATRINTAEQLVGAAYDAFYDSQFRDGDVNVMFRPWADKYLLLGFGLRGAQLNERMGLGLNGTFDDTPPGDNNNEELTHASLTNTGTVFLNVNNTVVGGGLTHVGGGATGFQGDIIGGVAATPSTLAITYDTKLTNDLLGPQFVLDSRLVETEYFLIDALFRAGVFYNHVKSELTETYRETNLDFSTYQKVYEDEKRTVAFLGNVGLMGGYRVNRYLALKLGYEGQLLSGVALAPEQWQSVKADNFGRTTYDLKTDGIVILHGITGAVDVTW